jgi:hypothetical protein
VRKLAKGFLAAFILPTLRALGASITRQRNPSHFKPSCVTNETLMMCWISPRAGNSDLAIQISVQRDAGAKSPDILREPLYLVRLPCFTTFDS